MILGYLGRLNVFVRLSVLMITESYVEDHVLIALVGPVCIMRMSSM